MFGQIIVTFLSICALVILFVPMEKVFPAKKGQKIFRKHWRTDLLYLLGNYLLFGTLVIWLLDQFNHSLGSIIPLSFRSKISLQPFWLQALEVILLSDFLIYWAHRLQHKIPFLWRFHKVHHSATHLDWLAAHREHPLDTLYTIGIINLPAFILGFPLETLSGFIAFRGLWAIYIHSNVRLPSGPLKWFIGSPELHHWHHDKNINAGNYANISPLMDIAFGTYVCPDREPEEFGIHETFPETYVSQMITPLRPSNKNSETNERATTSELSL